MEYTYIIHYCFHRGAKASSGLALHYQGFIVTLR